VELDNFDKIENPSKAAVRFVNKDGKVIHSQSFDSNGKAELNITMFAFLKAGGPFTAQIKVSAHGKSEEFNASIPFKLSEENVLLKATYDPGESKEEEEITTAEQSTEETVKETSTATQNKEETKTTRRADETQKPQTTKVPKPEYDYQAALSKWVADYTAEWKRTHEPDVTDSYTQTYEFEWVVYPTIRGNEVVGAHRVWSEKTFHGPMAGQPPVRWISSEFCDAERPCRYLYLGELKNMYPQFGS
ncbi:MAG TPA: hypothetical protein P5127_04950, partial [Oscillospiraceae bacterium]|nr:hypothetical protein [Oscillospiraceae bacterium]